MSSAGQQLVAGRIPGEIIGSPDIVTADSANFTTTETVVQDITVSLVSGRTYQVWWQSKWMGDVAGDRVLARLREDNVSGTEMQVGQLVLETASSQYGPMMMTAFYTAVATGSKTFVGCGDRNAGTGNIHLEASATNPCLMWVEYVSG